MKKSNASYTLPSYIPIANASKVDLSVSKDGDLAISYFGQQGFSTFQVLEITRTNGNEISWYPNNFLPNTINFGNNSSDIISLYGNNSSLGTGNQVYSLFQDTPNQTEFYTNQNRYNSIQSNTNESIVFIRVGNSPDLYYYQDGLQVLKLTDIQSSSLEFLNFDWIY